MSEVTDRHRQLVEKLYQQTVTRNLKWRSADYRTGFEADIGGYTINLSSSPTEFDEVDYFVSIFDAMNNEVESFKDTDIGGAGVHPENSVDPTYYQLMQRMYKTVAREARGADQALEKILGELDDMLSF